VTAFVFNFTQPDGPLPSGLSVLRGTATVRNQRLVPTVDGTLGAIVVADAGLGGGDATVSLTVPGGTTSGGHAVYFRVADANNWWRFSLRRYSYSYQSGYVDPVTNTQSTTYYNHNYYCHYGTPGYVTSGGQAIDGFGFPIGSSGTTDPNPPQCPSSYVYDGYLWYLGQQTGSTTSYVDTQTYTTPGYATYSTAYDYELRLEKCVGGTVTTVKSSTTNNGRPTSLRVVARGGSITCYTSLSSSPSFAAITDSQHQGATKHGGGLSRTTENLAADGVDDLVISPDNTVALAPTPLEPVGNRAVDRLQTQTFRVQPNDPDPGDTLSRLRVRYRPDGTADWTTISQDGPLTSLTRPAGTFTLGKWEWQAETTDAGGLVSPWSASEFFTAAETPGAPTISSPANNATLSEPNTGQVAWSAADQEALQVRVFADLAGSVNTAVLLYDSDVQVEASTRAWTVPRPVNGRVEHTQVRVRYLGLWSPWASVRNTVAYTAPAAPNLTLTLDPRGMIACLLSHPTPVGGQPAVAYSELWRRRTGNASTLMLADRLPSGTYLDALVAHRVDYEYQAIAVGVNGSRKASGWTATATNNTPTPVGSVAYGTGTFGEGAFA
jgi:hypothetical protein